MKQKEIVNIVNKVYPLISKDNNSHAKLSIIIIFMKD